MKSKIYEFDAELKFHPDMDAAYIEFPYNCYEEFGIRGQVKITAKIDGIDYRGSLAKMKTDCHVLGILKSIREQINKGRADTVHIVLQQDNELRAVIIPDDLCLEFDEYPVAKDIFDKMSYTHRKEYIDAIESAKKPETRINRIEKTIEMLLSKKK